MTRLSLDEIRLFESHIQHIVASYLPAVTSFDWSKRQKLSVLLTHCSSAVEQLNRLVDQYEDFNKGLFKDINKVKELLLFQKHDESLYSGDSFIEDLVKQRTAVILVIRNDIGKMENELFNLYEKIIGPESAPTYQAIWQSYVESVDVMWLDAQREVFHNSMFYLEKMLISSRAIPENQMMPLFELRIVLNSGMITSKPLLDHLLECITHLCDILLEGFQKIPCLLRRYDNEKSKSHDHKQELLTQAMVNVQERIGRKYEENTLRLHEILRQWETFRDAWESRGELFMSEYTSCYINTEQLERDVAALKKRIAHIETMKEVIVFGTFYINFIELKKDIVTRYEQRIQEILNYLFSASCQQLERVELDLKSVEQLEIVRKDDTDSFLANMEACKNMTARVKDGEKLLSEIEQNINVLRSLDYCVPNDVVNMLENINHSKKSIYETIDRKVFEVEMDFNYFKRDVSIRSEELKLLIVEMKRSFKIVLPTKPSEDFESQFKIIQELQVMMTKIKEKLTINEELTKLSLPVIDFKEKESMTKKLHTLQEIWTLTQKWEAEWGKWSSFPVVEISDIALEETIRSYRQNFLSIESSY